MAASANILGMSISRNAFLLAAFAIVSTGFVSATFLSTKDIIAAQERLAREKALLDIVPQSRHNNSMLDDTTEVKDQDLLGYTQPRQAFIAKLDGKPIAIILPAVAPDGYGGKIELIVGINIDGSIAGVRTLTHSETPGLGDNVEIGKSSWILSFNGKSLSNPSKDLWKVKKDKGVFDQFTGATITPRAVTKAIFKSLQYFQMYKDTLLTPPTSTTPVAIIERTHHD